jgi:hypothetical protein
MSGDTSKGGPALHWRILIASVLLTAKAAGTAWSPTRETH